MPLWLAALLWGWWGLCFGSFLNVVSWRLPRDLRLGGRSQCPHCGHVLAWYDLVPVLSFVVLRGRCRYCQEGVSWRYPLFELVCGLLFAGVVLHVGVGTLLDVVTILLGSVIAATALVVFVTDFEYYVIFDKVLQSAGVLLLPLLAVQSFLVGGPWFLSHIFLGIVTAAVVYGLGYLLWRLTQGRAFGFGDVKYLALMGLALGPASVAAAFFIAIMLGAFVGVVLLLTGQKQLSSKLPFGTFLSIGFMVAWLYGPALVAWYLRLILVV